MRLRPSGASGPIATEAAAFRRYHEKDAWTWEHMALTRARPVAGDPSLAAAVMEGIGAVLCTAREPESLLADVAAMRERVAGERATDNRWRLKHVRGGLLDLEFIAQFHLLRHAAQHPSILVQSTQAMFRRLGEAGVLDTGEATALAGMAAFLQRLQGLLRLTVGTNRDVARFTPGVRETLARAMGASDFGALETRIVAVQDRVRAVYRRLIADPRRGAGTRAGAIRRTQMTTAIDAGNPAPAFTAPSDDGGSLSLKNLRGRAVVLYFYPRDDTPGCTREAQEFAEALPKFARAGAEIVGVSKDSAARHDSFRAKYALPFTLVSDADGDICERYGVWVEKKNYGRTYMGIERATFLIDPAGTVSKVWRRVKVAGHVDKVLEAVQALNDADG